MILPSAIINFFSATPTYSDATMHFVKLLQAITRKLFYEIKNIEPRYQRKLSLITG